MARDGGEPETAGAEERAEETPVAVADPPADPELLQNQLREKEQLVGALTVRLEQAAEQLDRLRRTGVDKGRRPLGAGFPIEVIEDHKNTLEDLKRVIARWEDMQAEATLGRIETQITELRDLVAGSGGVAVSHAAPHSRERRTESAPAPPPRPAGKAGGNAWWEAQKAALLGGGSPPADDSHAAPAPAAEPAVRSAPAEPGHEAPAPRTEDQFDLGGFQIPELPAEIDFENLSLDDARQAIRERDRIIQQLREPLLLLQAAGQLPADAHSLAGLPEALRQRITEIEAQWQAKFRQVELDLSLERARLAREQAAIRQQQDALQKQLRRGNGGPSKHSSEDSGKGDDSSRRRWFRFMGKGEGDAGESETGKNG